jgi:hypothetical protein
MSLYLLYTTFTCFGRVPWPYQESYKFCRRIQRILLPVVDNRQNIYIFSSVVLRPTAGLDLFIFEVSRLQATTHHSRYDSSGRVIISSQRIYLTTLIQTAIRPAGFELSISADERPQTYALDRGHWARLGRLYIYTLGSRYLSENTVLTGYPIQSEICQYHRRLDTVLYF